MKRLLTIVVITVILGLIAWGYVWLSNEETGLEVENAGVDVRMPNNSTGVGIEALEGQTVVESGSIIETVLTGDVSPATGDATTESTDVAN